MIWQKPGAMISLKREEILIIFFGIAFFNFSLAASQFLPFCVQGPKGLQGGTLAQLAPMLRLGSSYFTRTVGLGWFGQPSCDLRKQPPRRRLRPAGGGWALQHFQMAFEKTISRKSLKKACGCSICLKGDCRRTVYIIYIIYNIHLCFQAFSVSFFLLLVVGVAIVTVVIVDLVVLVVVVGAVVLVAVVAFIIAVAPVPSGSASELTEEEARVDEKETFVKAGYTSF